MEMNTGEIRASYRQAKDPQAQIKVLAELNACSTNQIKEVLGLPVRETAMDKADFAAKVQEFNVAGFNDGEIGKKLGVSANSVKYWHNKLGLPVRAVRGGGKKVKKEDTMKKDETTAAPAATESQNTPISLARSQGCTEPKETETPSKAGLPPSWYETAMECQADTLHAYRIVLFDLIRNGCIEIHK